MTYNVFGGTLGLTQSINLPMKNHQSVKTPETFLLLTHTDIARTMQCSVASSVKIRNNFSTLMLQFLCYLLCGVNVKQKQICMTLSHIQMLGYA